MGASGRTIQPQEERGQLEYPLEKELCKDTPQVLGMAIIAEDIVI